MIRCTRRDFLATTSSVVAAAALGRRTVHAQQLAPAILRSSLPATAWMPDPLTSTVLRSFASSALDAAKRAGAHYADVRVAERQCLQVGLAGVAMQSTFTFGVRALVDGAWAFAHGSIPTPDALAAAARDAVVAARSFALWNKSPAPMYPAPAHSGSWETPYELDPFTVPIGDQRALVQALVSAAQRVRDGDGEKMGGASWTRETRVFASTDGSDILQTRRWVEPSISCKATVPWGVVGLVVPALWPSSGGYERLNVPGLQDTIKAKTEELTRLFWLPQRMLDVGRYPAVFQGEALGSVLISTLGRAVELDRALGYQAGADGTSYLSPPSEILGSRVASPLLTLIADRALPSITAVQWDDDGTIPRVTPIIRNGALVEYMSSRQTAADLGAKTPSNGCAVAPTADSVVSVRLPHLSVSPSTARASIEDLCHGIRRGIYVMRTNYMSTDSSLTSGLMGAWNTTMFEIENGKLVRRLKGSALQFSTARFWKSLYALGDATTMVHAGASDVKGMPETRNMHNVSAPAGAFKEVDLVSASVVV